MAIPSNFLSGEILEASELNDILGHLRTGLTVPAGPSTSRPLPPPTTNCILISVSAVCLCGRGGLGKMSPLP